MIQRPAHRRCVGGALVLLCVLLPAVGAAQRVLRYSGKVQRVDLRSGLVVVEELAEAGRPRWREVYVRAETSIVTAGRLRSWEAYGEMPVSLADLLTGDFVVVESVESSGRPTARRITIVEPPRRSR